MGGRLSYSIKKIANGIPYGKYKFESSPNHRDINMEIQVGGIIFEFSNTYDSFDYKCDGVGERLIQLVVPTMQDCIYDERFNSSELFALIKAIQKFNRAVYGGGEK